LKNDRHMGVALIICSAVCFALMGACIKLSGDLPRLQKSFFRNIVTLLCSAAVLRRQGIPLSCPKGSAWAMSLRCVFGTVGLLGNFYAVDHLVLADANILDKLDPFFCILFSAAFLGEGFTPFQASAVAALLRGACLSSSPPSQTQTCSRRWWA
jgi:drug/metabolite transporter (DMT)-like permease